MVPEIGTVFTDGNGNSVVQVASPATGFEVFELVGEPGHGYVVDATWGKFWPGPCVGWFGPGESHVNAASVIAADKAAA